MKVLSVTVFFYTGIMSNYFPDKSHFLKKWRNFGLFPPVAQNVFKSGYNRNVNNLNINKLWLTKLTLHPFMTG